MTTEPAADHRAVTLRRLDTGVYEARNPRGDTIRFGSNAADGFSPVELLLAAIGGCSAVDVDTVTSRRVTPSMFEVDVSATKVRDDEGNHLQDIAVVFRLAFPDGAEGERARELAPRAARASHQVSCTVSRTVERGTPIQMTVRGDAAPPSARRG